MLDLKVIRVGSVFERISRGNIYKEDLIDTLVNDINTDFQLKDVTKDLTLELVYEKKDKKYGVIDYIRTCDSIINKPDKYAKDGNYTKLFKELEFCEENHTIDVRLESYAYRCTLEVISISSIKDKHRVILKMRKL